MITRVVLAWALCCTLSASAAELFPTNSIWRYFRGTNEASRPDLTAWRAPGFNDAAFTSAPAPFWYGDIRPGGTQLADMLNSYTCVFLRKSFTATDAASVSGLRLTYFIDDGLVVWLNGVELYRENVADANPTISTLAANQPTDPAALVSRVVVLPPGALVNGDNVLAVQIFNTTIASSDLGFDLAADTIAAETVPPVILAKTPPPGTVSNLTQMTVTFSEPVTGVDAGDLLLNGIPVDGVTGQGTTYTFTFPPPPFGEVFVTWSAGHGIADEATPPNPFNPSGAGATWQYDYVDRTAPAVVNTFPAPGSALRTLSQIEVTFNEEVLGVGASDLLINGQPATSVSRSPGGPYVFQFASPSAGPVQIQWAAGNGITDQAVPPNAFAGGSWTYTIDPNLAAANLVITEILASNQSGLQDEDGQEEDWIEIHNRGTTTVDLTGWALSDDPELPGLWTFGQGSIPPGGYMVVFASGKDRRTPAAGRRFHTNFQLSGGGEFLGLYNADSPRLLVSSLGAEYPEQRNDYSYGLDPQGAWRYYAVPSPGFPNGTSTITGVSEPVHFSMSRGFFTQPFDLALSSPTPGVTIRYTLNGSEPTEAGGLPYVGPLRITNNTFVRAVAFRPGLLPSTVRTHSYLFNQSATIRSLPVLSLVTATSNLIGRTGIIGMGGGGRSGDGAFITNNPATDFHNPSMHGIAWERPVSAELIEPDDEGGFQIDCGIRVQGSDWQRPRTTPTSKFSFRLYFRGDYGAGRLEYPVFPRTTVQTFDQLVLRAGYNEAANPFIRDELSRRLFADMGNVSAQGRFFHVFTNGGYAGYYNPTERVHEEFGQAHHGGSSDWDIITPSFATSNEGIGIVDGDRNDFNNLHNYINGQSASSIATPSVYLEVARRLDLKNFVDYCLINAHAAMGDWPANNWRAGKDRGPGGIWRFYVWDAEWGFGFSGRGFTRDSFAEAGGGPSDSGLNSIGASEIARMYQKLRNSREFRLLWADRVHRHYFNGGALTDLAITNRLSEMRTELAPTFAMNMAELGPFLANRRNVMLGLLNFYGLYGGSNALYGFFASSNAPALSQHGGRVAPGFTLTMTSPLGGTIYYTTNGADPRVPFSGAVSNAALAYTGPITLSQSIPFKARTLLNGTNWSALADTTFEVGTVGVPVRITEIMYNPPGGSIHEFVELQNIGSTPLDLSEFRFTEGITYTFLSGTIVAPGGRVLLANGTDTNAFAARYPGVAVTGYFSGNLANDGERITLVDRNSQIVASVAYDDTGSTWPTEADGAGASLELVDVFGDPNAPSNWRTNPALTPTPGAANTILPPPAIELSELLADNAGAVNHEGSLPDFVELFNPGAAPASLAGWSLTDNGNPRQFVFPAGTSIPAQGRLVVWLDAVTNTTSGLHAGFALEQLGDQVLLFNASTGLVDTVSLGLQIPNFSVGRLNNQWLLQQPTPGQPNVAAPTAAASVLRINEWMANANPGQPDWIELFNPAALPVDLRGVHVSNGPGLQRLASLSFIGAGGFVQLFANEETGPDDLAFRLPATGATLSLFDAAATLVDSVAYTAATEGVSRGRLPDGSTTLASFTGSASPGAPNYTVSYAGPVLNEILARASTLSPGAATDFIELINPSAATADVSGMSLGFNAPAAGQWTFPAGTTIPAGGLLLVRCDGASPASFLPGSFNTGVNLDGDSGTVQLFNAARQPVDTVDFGPQADGLSIGRIAGAWRLLANPTPGAANSAAALLASNTSLRINEWMADPAAGSDWFELHNTAASAVELSGLILTDDASASGLAGPRIAPLSFIGPAGFTRWIADGNIGDGRHHAPFSLNAGGESILLLATNGANFILLDGLTFVAQQRGVSEGRLPDGAPAFTTFPGSATPGEINHRLAPVVISEIIPAAVTPGANAIEIANPTDSAVNVSGWFVSDAKAQGRKYRIPDGTVLAPGAALTLTQAAFGNNGTNSFALSAARGGEIWLSAADAGGTLTGYRAGASYGPADATTGYRRVVTSTGIDLAPFTLSPGDASPTPGAGPVVLSEIHYNPAGAGEEYIELLNVTGSAVALFDPARPANRWRLAGGVSFDLPAATTLPAGGRLLVVGFDPANAISLGAFRARYGVSPAVPVTGPFIGRLDNAADDVSLLRPAAPVAAGADAGLIPWIPVDRAGYRDTAPWPAGLVDGGGYSLQRRPPAGYGNEALNWFGAVPTPGAAESTAGTPLPAITSQPQGATLFEGQASVLTVSASGGAPLAYQWRFNGIDIPGATSAAYALDYPVLENDGAYDVVVSNPAGSTLSAAARIAIRVPPVILTQPVGVVTFPGSNVVFSVLARGSSPLTYQWRLNGTNLPGRTSPTLALTNVQITDDGLYECAIVNPAGSAIASARLDILVRPAITVQPLNQSTAPNGTLSFSVEATGNPLPFTFEWRRGSLPIFTNVVNRRSDIITLTITNTSGTVQYRAVVKNAANPNPGVASSFATVTILADADADGLPDTWESQYGFNPASDTDRDLDTDEDGASNFEEYVAGTEPNNPASYLRVDLGVTLGETANAAAVTFNALATKSYSVLYTDNLGQGTWTKLQDTTARTTNRVEIIPDPEWRPARYYQLVTPAR